MSDDAAQRARAHQDALAKPRGALGRLEELAIFFAAARGRFPVEPPSRAALPVFVADHGVAAHGVSTHPSAVTALVAGAVLTGGSAISVLARAHGVALSVVDVGLAHDVPARALAETRVPFVAARVRPGTADLRLEPAMTRDEAARAIAVGVRAAREAVAAGADVLLTGEIGIGNTTAAACLVAAFTGQAPERVTGRGSGIGDEALARKTTAVRAALARHGPGPHDPLGALAAVGGLELAALAGLAMEGARLEVPVVLDGYLAGASALVACAIAPDTRARLLAAHTSAEPGHAIALEALGMRPLLDLGMRLGEGTGAVLGFHLLRTSVTLACEMATLASLVGPQLEGTAPEWQ